MNFVFFLLAVSILGALFSSFESFRSISDWIYRKDTGENGFKLVLARERLVTAHIVLCVQILFAALAIWALSHDFVVRSPVTTAVSAMLMGKTLFRQSVRRKLDRMNYLQ
jgi:hypothetical protein